MLLEHFILPSFKTEQSYTMQKKQVREHDYRVDFPPFFFLVW